MRAGECKTASYGLDGKQMGRNFLYLQIYVEIHWVFFIHLLFIYKYASTYTFISLYTYTEMWKGGMERERKRKKRRSGETESDSQA